MVINKTHIFIGIAILSIFIFIYTNLSTSYKNYPPKNSTIVAFGDSLVEGVGSTKDNDFVSILSRRINKEIINSGKSGNTTEDGLSRVHEIMLREPGTVIVLLGGNDYLRKFPDEQTFKNLKSIIFKLQSEGIFVILLGIRGGLLNDRFESQFEDLSKEMNVPYVENVLSGLIGNDKYMSDSIHPNDTGYAIIAGKIYKEVGEYLK